MGMDYPTVGKTYRLLHKNSGNYFGKALDLVEESEAVVAAFYPTDTDLHRYMWADTKQRPGYLVGVVPAATWPFLEPVAADAARPEWVTFELDADGDHFRFWNPDSDHYIRYDADQKLFMAKSEKDPGGDDLFSFEEVDSFVAVVKVEKVDPQTLPTPELTSYDQPPEYQPTPDVLTGVSAVPFFLVKKDADHDAAWQAENSPYYIIERHSRWHRVAWEVFPRGKTSVHSWSTVIGVEKEEATEVDEGLNVSVTANAGFSFEGLSAGVSTTVGDSLNVKHTTGTKESFTSTDGHSDTYGPYMQDVAIADWLLQDHYRIYRADGEKMIQEFTVTVPDTHVSRTFPKSTAELTE